MDGAVRLAISHLRRRVTLPLELEQVEDLQSVLDAAERLPRVSCAFSGCPWAEAASTSLAIADIGSEPPWDRSLRHHVLQQHGPLIQKVAGVEEEWIWDVYKQALAEQERQSVPAVGAAIDRRAFECTLQRYNDERIQALICFGCARICVDTGGSHSHIEYKKGGWFLGLDAGHVE